MPFRLRTRLHLDRALMLINNPLGDGEAKASAARDAAGFIRSVKSLENMGDLTLIHPKSRILDTDSGPSDR